VLQLGAAQAAPPLPHHAHQEPAHHEIATSAAAVCSRLPDRTAGRKIVPLP